MKRVRRSSLRNRSRQRAWRCLAPAVWFVWTATVASTAYGVTFTVSPSTINSDYLGAITFTVTGLTPGQTVVVEKYADFNQNGSVDAGEELVDYFTVTDGDLPLIAGVRNLNVPGDDDGAENGTITTRDFLSNAVGSLTGIAGSYVYVLSDPAHTFAPLFQPFTVNQHTSLPQGITGTVTATGSGQPAAYALVLLGEPTRFIERSGVFADANGRYTIYTAPGTYGVAPVSIAPGYVSNFTVSPTTVPAGQFVTQDRMLIPAGLKVSGTVSDSVSGAGIPGIGVVAQSSTGLLTFATTRPDGRYSLQVTPGDWQVGPPRNGPERAGYIAVVNEDPTTITGNISIDFQLPKATAVIYGSVVDTSERPVPGLDMNAEQPSGPLAARGHTVPLLPPAYNYSIGVVGGSWQGGPSSDDLAPAGCSILTGDGNVTLADGEAVRRDFTLQCAGVLTCVGDCGNDDQVTVDEILTMVNIALGNVDVSECDAGDLSQDGQITVDEILTAVNNALNGCPGSAELSMATPYVNSADIASINEAFSSTASAPWGFAHNGVDFFPNGDLKPFQAVATGTVDHVELWQNNISSNWQVNVRIRIDATYAVEYAFESFSAVQTEGEAQRANVLVSAGRELLAGDLIGNLHVAGSAAHVHFSLYKNDTAICPEAYFSPAAAESVLALTHRDPPSWEMCY